MSHKIGDWKSSWCSDPNLYCLTIDSKTDQPAKIATVMSRVFCLHPKQMLAALKKGDQFNLETTSIAAFCLSRKFANLSIDGIDANFYEDKDIPVQEVVTDIGKLSGSSLKSYNTRYFRNFVLPTLQEEHKDWLATLNLEFGNLGPLRYDREYEYFITEAVLVPCLFDGKAQFTLKIKEDIENNSLNLQPYLEAITNFISCNESLWHNASQKAINYCRTCEDVWETEEDDRISIKHPTDIWNHTSICEGYSGEAASISAELYQGIVYLIIEGNCEWEPEHGLQIVIRNGQEVTRVSDYDGDILSYTE